MNTQSQATPVIRVENTDIPVTVYQDQRVITTELLAQVYDTDTDNLKKNFSRNESRFQNGVHYFKLEGTPLRDFKSLSPQIPKQARHLILWTERGAARHAKMLDTDQAWDVFDELESAYFELKKALPTPEPAKLPSTDDLPPDVLAAIDRRAQMLTMRQYDHIKNQLHEAIKKFASDRQGKELVDFVQTIELPDSKLVIVHRDTLWRLTAKLSTLEVVQRQALDAVHTLEQETGVEWYGR